MPEFTQGYIEALFFTNGDCGSEDESLLDQLGTDRLTRAARKRIAQDCERFLSHIMPDGCFVRQWLDRLPDYDDAQAGRDFWFTRQGHGVGFWDRSQLEQDAGEYFASICAPAQWTQAMRDQFLAVRGKSFGEHLSDAAEQFGESYVYVHQGWIHVT